MDYLYVSFPIVLLYLGFGFSDITSVSFSIWAIYFMVLAIRKDSKFFYLAFPFAMFAFLTRYNSGLLIFPIFLYILMNRTKIEYKNFILGIGASIIVIIPVFLFFFEKFGNILYPFINFSSTSTTTAAAASGSASYNPDVFFFVDKFPAFVGTQGIIIIMIVILGVVLYLFLRIFRDKNSDKLFEGMIIKNNIIKIKWIAFVVLGIICLGSFDKTIYIISEVLFLSLAYLFYDLSKDKIKDVDFHIMVFSWFIVFFIFSSIFVIKDTRYFLLMAPPVAYFMILGLIEISKALNFKIKNVDVVFPMIAIFITAIILFSTATQLPIIMNANTGITMADEQVKMASQWIINYDPDFKNKIIYSELSPNFSWYLHTTVKQLVIPSSNQTISSGNNVTSNHDIAINNYLSSNGADYYLCDIQGLNLSSYKSIKQFGNVTIYQRIYKFNNI